MAVYEWQGKLRFTIAALSRADKLDLWVAYSRTESYKAAPPEHPFVNAANLMETDALITAVSTHKIEICIDGTWQDIQDEIQIEHDGDSFVLAYPPTAEMINHLPAYLADQWIEWATEKNGGLTANLSFFSSLSFKNGKTNNEAKSEEPLSNTPT